MPRAVQEALLTRTPNSLPPVRDLGNAPIRFTGLPNQGVIVFDGNRQNEPIGVLNWRTSPPKVGYFICIDHSNPPKDGLPGLSKRTIKKFDDEVDDALRRGIRKDIAARSINDKTDSFEVREGNEGSDFELIRKRKKKKKD